VVSEILDGAENFYHSADTFSRGQGSFPYYGSQLYLLTMPVLYICGKLDEKYSQIGKDFAKTNPNTVLVRLKNAGHNTHMEQPVQFERSVKSFLRHYNSTVKLREFD